MKLFGLYIENCDFRHKMEQWRIDYFQLKAERDSLQYRLDLLNEENDLREQIGYQQKMLTLHGADLDAFKSNVNQILSITRSEVNGIEGEIEEIVGVQEAQAAQQQDHAERIAALEKIHPKRKA